MREEEEAPNRAREQNSEVHADSARGTIQDHMKGFGMKLLNTSRTCENEEPRNSHVLTAVGVQNQCGLG